MNHISSTVPHTCSLYHSSTEQAAIVTQFLLEGLAHREKIIYIINPWDNGSFLNSLPQDNTDVASAITRGQLTFLTTTETYLHTTPFEPTHMIQLLHQATDQAIQEGYLGLRITADMGWALHHTVPPQKLITYETQVDAFLNHKTCKGLCQYNRWNFPTSLLEDVLPIHASIIAQGREYSNEAHHTFTDILLDLENPS